MARHYNMKLNPAVVAELPLEGTKDRLPSQAVHASMARDKAVRNILLTTGRGKAAPLRMAMIEQVYAALLAEEVAK